MKKALFFLIACACAALQMSCSTGPSGPDLAGGDDFPN
jgi:hypothetical protein